MTINQRQKLQKKDAASKRSVVDQSIDGRSQELFIPQVGTKISDLGSPSVQKNLAALHIGHQASMSRNKGLMKKLNPSLGIVTRDKDRVPKKDHQQAVKKMQKNQADQKGRKGSDFKMAKKYSNPFDRKVILNTTSLFEQTQHLDARKQEFGLHDLTPALSQRNYEITLNINLNNQTVTNNSRRLINRTKRHKIDTEESSEVLEQLCSEDEAGDRSSSTSSESSDSGSCTSRSGQQFNCE